MPMPSPYQIGRSDHYVPQNPDRRLSSEIIYHIQQLLIQGIEGKLALSDGSNEITSKPIALGPSSIQRSE